MREKRNSALYRIDIACFGSSILFGAAHTRYSRRIDAETRATHSLYTDVYPLEFPRRDTGTYIIPIYARDYHIRESIGRTPMVDKEEEEEEERKISV